MPTWAPKEERMPWYESSSKSQSSSASHNAPISTCNPYKCTLRINVSHEDGKHVKTIYSPLLQGIDPTFQLIQIQDNEDNENTSDLMALQCSPLPTMGLPTQALSVILFLRDEAHSQLTAAVAKDYLSNPPWKFHHKIELTSRFDLRTVARQEYFECAPRHHLPLWSICSTHCGNEQLRFNIFVKNFDKMKHFYSLILNEQVQASKPGFCSFRIYSQPGLDIQLSLKYSPCLLPEPTVSAQLCFLVDDISLLRGVLPYEVVPYVNSIWWTRDVDGNSVLLLEDMSPTFRELQGSSFNT